MGNYPTGPDQAYPYKVGSYANAAYIIVWAFWGVVAISLVSFQLLKRAWLAKRPAPVIYMNEAGASENSKEASFVPEEESPQKQNGKDNVQLDIPQSKSTQFQAYKETLFGRLCYILISLTSLLFVGLFVLLLYDYYAGCQVKGIDAWCFYGSYPVSGGFSNNGPVFFVLWVMNIFWFTTLVILRGKVRNMYRLQCDMTQATTVVVWEPLTTEVLSANVSWLVLQVRKWKARLMTEGMRGEYTTVPVDSTKAGVRFFLHHGVRFVIKGETIYRGELSVGESFADFHNAGKGLTVEDAALRLDHVGPNAIPFKVDNLWRLINNEFVSFFYNYQWIFYQLWFWFSYLFPAIINACVVLGSGVVNMYLTNRSQRAIAKLSEYVTECEVLRGGEWVKVDSRDLVPGDVVRLRSDWLLPADLMLTQGACVCNESALTGEAMPVQKHACPNNTTIFDAHSASRYMLFAGTKLLQAGNNKGDVVIAVVSATGMQTGKGELLSEILYPQSMLFKYDEELVIVLIMLFVYAGLCAILAIIIQSVRGANSDWVTKWIYMTFIISQILSPILPVALNVGQMNAMERLKRKGVNCLNAKRIAISGKIRIFCFDKTGTLTRDGLDFLGVKPVVNGELQTMNTEPASMPEHVLNSLATCHAVSSYGDGFVGNQVEVKMFEATNWTLVESQGKPTEVTSPDGSRTLTIVRKNEFDHAKATMSVIVRDQNGQHFVFCKGSFERIGNICQPESLPGNYMQEAQALALEGCYVLGFSMKPLHISRSEEALAMSRDQLEEGLTFTALMAFRNELKHDTRDAIIEMKEGNVRPVMITGDNAQCGQYIAKACGMTTLDCPLYLADVHDGKLMWKLSGAENINQAAISSEQMIQTCLPEQQAGRMELAMTGKAFRMLRHTSLLSDILFFCRIFARVTPEEKVQVCALFRDAGLILGMAGDGGNDCGALRAAHAGVALSDAEASVVSPFTSKSKSVASCVDLLREGRGALHTSFGAVKFLIIYGLNFSVLKLASYWFGLIVCPFMYLSIDAFALLTLGYAVTLSHPVKRLGKRRPTSSLIGPLQVASNFGYWVISVAFLVGAIYLMKADPDYVAWPREYAQGASWWTLGDNWESTIIFFVLYFNYISAAFIFTFGSEFRRPVFFNYVLMAAYLFLMIFYSWLLLSSPNNATRYYHVASQAFNAPNPDKSQGPVWYAYQQAGGAPSPGMSKAFRFKFWALCMANTLTCIIWQKGCAEGLLSNWMRKRFPSKRPEFNM